MSRVDAVVVGGGTVGRLDGVLPRRGGPLGGAGRGRHARQRRQQPGGRHGARAGRHRGGDPAGAVQPRVLRRAARSLPARLRIRRPGLPDAVLHRRRGRRRAGTGSRSSARSASTWSGSTPTRSTGGRPGWRPGSPAVRRSPPVTATSTRPATCSPTPPRSCALGVDVRERCAFTGLRVHDGRVVGVDTAAGLVEADAVVLTGGPDLAAVGAAAGGRIVAGGTRHQVVVTAPVPGVDPGTLPMVFDVASGIYWRPGEDGGLLWGMSNPDEAAGAGPRVRLGLLRADARPRGDAVPRDRGARRTARLGGHHRLHAGPPPPPRAAADRRRAGRGHGRRRSRWPRDDVGSGSRPRGRGPGARTAAPTSSTSPTSVSTASTPRDAVAWRRTRSLSPSRKGRTDRATWPCSRRAVGHVGHPREPAKVYAIF